MIYITLTDHNGIKLCLNIEAIGYFKPHQAPAFTEVFITGGTGGSIYVSETPEQITEKLKEAGAEFVP